MVGKKRVGKKLETVGITLRPSIELLNHYKEIAMRANRMASAKGNYGNITFQDVILQRMGSLPSWKSRQRELDTQSNVMTDLPD